MSVHPRGLRRKPARTNLSRSEMSTISRESTLASAEEDHDQVPELGMAPGRVRPLAPSRPTAIVLAFRQLGFNAMVAACAAGSPGEGVRTGRTSAQYHISVHMNCFCPSSFVTVIRRGTVDGEFVGSFECVARVVREANLGLIC